jgi:phenylacetate-CoA ligase
VRYRTGDIGVMDGVACACGRGLPRLSEIQGRSTDFVITDDGTVMHGLSLIYVIRDLAGVKSFKVTQETRRLTRVELVTEAGFDPSAVPAIVAGFKRRLGAAVDVQVQIVPSIAPEKSGKYRYIVSHALATAH